MYLKDFGIIQSPPSKLQYLSNKSSHLYSVSNKRDEVALNLKVELDVCVCVQYVYKFTNINIVIMWPGARGFVILDIDN